MYEHDEPSKGFPMVNLSSEEEGVDLDTSQDEDVACKLFDDLNHDLLGPLGDGNIIISDSEEEEVRKNDRTDTDVAPSSLRVSLTPSASTTDDEDASDGVQDDSSDGDESDRV
jgi:hypothetical protein